MQPPQPKNNRRTPQCDIGRPTFSEDTLHMCRASSKGSICKEGKLIAQQYNHNSPHPKAVWSTTDPAACIRHMCDPAVRQRHCHIAGPNAPPQQLWQCPVPCPVGRAHLCSAVFLPGLQWHKFRAQWYFLRRDLVLPPGAVWYPGTIDINDADSHADFYNWASGLGFDI